MSESWQAFVEGEWRGATSGETTTLYDPSTGEIIGTVPKLGKEETLRAIDSGREAFDHGPWPGMKGSERAKILKRAAEILSERAERLALLETRNAGKPIRQSTYFDIALAAEHLGYFAELAAHHTTKKLAQPDLEGSHGMVLKEPMGLCAGICPWNLPLLMAVWKAGPALAAGNTVILKPASLTPLTTLELARALDEAGLPKRTLQVLTGPGGEIGSLLASHPKIDKVSFTGSTDTGKDIMTMAAPTIKRTTLELGGKSANVILPDADLEKAVDGSLFGIFLHSGQLCESGSRLLVPQSRHDEIVKLLVDRARTIRLGPTQSFDTDMGPLVSQGQLERVENYIRTGKEEGAILATGGDRPQAAELQKGNYLNPTIFTHVTPGMKIAQEEIFGPVLAVIPYRNVEEAVEIANDTIFGLAGAVWSTSSRKAIAVAKRLRTGTVWINDYHMLSCYAPRGGYKQSGIGRELGAQALEEFSETKHLYFDEQGVLTPVSRGLVLPPK
jgi:aldehyde dehydrogenase (NAD+)